MFHMGRQSVPQVWRLSALMFSNNALQPTATGPVSFPAWEEICRSVTPAAYAPVAPSLGSMAGGAITRWLWLSLIR